MSELICGQCGGPAEGEEEYDDQEVCNDCYGEIQYDIYLDQQYDLAYSCQYKEVQDEHGNVYQPWSK